MVIIPDKGAKELSLNGSWEFAGEEPGRYVQIPGDLYAMGMHIVTDNIYEYRRLVHVPDSGEKGFFWRWLPYMMIRKL